MTTKMPAPNAWAPPEPREFAEWRNRIVDYFSTPHAVLCLADAIDNGKFAALPVMPGFAGGVYHPEDGTFTESTGAVAAPILARSEHDRLAQASLFYASDDMTSLAVAAAHTPPNERFSHRRLPADTGFMIFAEPIGGYSIPVRHAVPEWSVAREELTLTTPIVAVSWSHWRPDAIEQGGGPLVDWYRKGPRGLQPIPADFDGVWFTFYSDSATKWAEIDPNEPIARMRDGTIITAGDIDKSNSATSSPPMMWDNESLVNWGSDLSRPPELDTIDQWVHVVYTAFQLMSQVTGKKPLTESEEVHRPRHGRKRDARAGITGPPVVKVVRLHSAYRPSKEATEEDASRSSGRRQPNWSCRWPVTPHRRNMCLNPRKHKDGECDHDDRIIPLHVKGPKDKPFRVPNTVRLWDTPPD